MRPRPNAAYFAAVLLAGGALVFDPGGWQVFGPVKWLVITVGALGGAAAALSDDVELHRPSLIGWAMVVAWAAVTSVVAEDPLSAWLGTPDRRFGFVALSTLAAAFVTGQAVRDRAAAVLLGRAAVVALGGMAVYGVAEALGAAPVALTTTTSRIGSTFGSPAYLGAAACLFVPVAVGTAADPGQPRAWRALAIVAGAGGVGLLAGSGTRAAAVGLGVAGVLLLPRWLPFLRRRPVMGVAAAVAVAAAVSFSPLGERVAEPVGGRVAEWRIASRALAADPVTGAGLEGYRIVFPAHVDVGYVRDYGRATITDRAHSGPLDLGVTLGIPGVVAWVTAAAWLALRCSRAIASRDPVLSGMAAGVVAVLAQELFLFPTLEVSAGMWAVAGAVIASASPQPSVPARSKSAAAAAAGLAVVAAVAGLLDVVADHRAAEAVERGDLAAADDALVLRPDSFRYALLAADVAFRRGDLAGALRGVEEAAALSPRDPAVRIARARVVAASGDTASALGVLEAAVEADPNHPELRILLGDVQAQAGRPGEAERSWLAAAHLAPSDPTPHLRLAALYISAGEVELARESLETARRLDPDHAAIADLEDALRQPAGDDGRKK